MTIKASIALTGTQPLICHNVEMANPMNPTVMAMKEITGKRKKTEADQLELARWEWYGGLYLDPTIQGPAIPTRSIRKCLIEGARLSKQGKDIERAVQFTDMYVPLAYEGSRDIDVLWAGGIGGGYVDQSMVGVSGKRVLRTRPKFPTWAVVADLWMEEDRLNLSTLRQVAEVAGRLIGLGDNRVNGFGRFTAEVCHG